MKLIPLSQNSKKNKGKFFAQVSDDMYEILNQWKWTVRKAGNTYYAFRNFPVINVSLDNMWGIPVFGETKIYTVQMHRFVLGVTHSGVLVDHIDHNGLNCQTDNLRECSHVENMQNASKNAKSLYPYKGIHKVLKKSRRCWVATICANGKKEYIGSFFSAEDAAMAYDKRAIELHKDFASLNFPA